MGTSMSSWLDYSGLVAESFFKQLRSEVCVFCCIYWCCLKTLEWHEFALGTLRWTCMVCTSRVIFSCLYLASANHHKAEDERVLSRQRLVVKSICVHCPSAQPTAKLPTLRSLVQVTRTREVIDRVEIQHEALGSEAPVTTVAEQRSTRRTTMERGGAKRTAALPSSEPVDVRPMLVTDSFAGAR